MVPARAGRQLALSPTQLRELLAAERDYEERRARIIDVADSLALAETATGVGPAD